MNLRAPVLHDAPLKAVIDHGDFHVGLSSLFLILLSHTIQAKQTRKCRLSRHCKEQNNEELHKVTKNYIII